MQHFMQNANEDEMSEQRSAIEVSKLEALALIGAMLWMTMADKIPKEVIAGNPELYLAFIKATLPVTLLTKGDQLRLAQALGKAAGMDEEELEGMRQRCREMAAAEAAEAAEGPIPPRFAPEAR